jgi:hypothetical protein
MNICKPILDLHPFLGIDNLLLINICYPILE